MVPPYHTTYPSPSQTQEHQQPPQQPKNSNKDPLALPRPGHPDNPIAQPPPPGTMNDPGGAFSVPLHASEAQRVQRFLQLAAAIGLSEEWPMPENSSEADLVEDTLASELDQLSLDEHERRQLQLYGLDTPSVLDPHTNLEDAASSVSSVSVPSTHTTIEQKLHEFAQVLSEKLSSSPASTTAAYRLAHYWNPSYDENDQFRLHFLRREQWIVVHAVDLFLYHFRMKRQLFGGTTTASPTQNAILGRRIRLDDLDADDLEALHSGFLQVGKAPDAAGRTLVYLSPAHRRFRTVRNLQRAFWYMGMSVLQDTNTEHDLGLVAVASFHRAGTISIPHLLNMRRTRLAMPFFLSCIHLCYCGSEVLRPSIAGIRMFQHCNPNGVLRVHQGEAKDTFAELKAFGIPVDGENGPLCTDGETWSTEWHEQRIQMLRTQEETTLETIEEYNLRPRRFDVLFGKNKESLQHPGTQRCNLLCEMFREQYEAASRREKTQVSDQILKIIGDSNGRFLKRGKQGTWMEADKATAREKISHFFRQKRSEALADQIRAKTDQSKLQRLSTTTNGGSSGVDHLWSDLIESISVEQGVVADRNRGDGKTKVVNV